MRLFAWLALLITICSAVFAIQNSTLPLVRMKFLFWQLETSPVYAMLGSLAAGMLIILFIWIPIALRASFRKRNLKNRDSRGSDRHEEEKSAAPSGRKQDDV